MESFLLFFLFLFSFSSNILAQSCGSGTRCPPGTSCNGSRCVPSGSTSSCSNTSDVNTALGCIPEPASLVKWVLQNAVLMGGGIAFTLSLGRLNHHVGRWQRKKLTKVKKSLVLPSPVYYLLFFRLFIKINRG